MAQFFAQGVAGLKLLIVCTLILGIGYPLVVTGLGRLIAPDQAAGSPIVQNGRVIGSSLIGQQFSGRSWFWPRPSVAGSGYDAMASGGSNLAANSPALASQIKQRRAQIAAADHVRPDRVPADAVTASGSGLDPDISPAYAAIQVDRVAAARGLAPAVVSRLVAAHTEGRVLGFLGEPRVNVLELNVALSELR